MCTIASGVENGTATVDNMAAPQKIKQNNHMIQRFFKNFLKLI